MTDKYKRIWLVFIIAVYFAIAYTLMKYFNISCVFTEFLGIPCPGCGMTRAFLSVLKMDVYSAVKYNVVIFFMPYVFAYIMFDFKHKVHNVLMSIIGIIAVVNWIIKIIIFI